MPQPALSPVTLLDGGTGRELKRIGAPFRQPEWSALALIEAPEFVTRVHQSYVDAGADVITTNTYALVPFHIGEERFAAQGRQHGIGHDFGLAAIEQDRGRTKPLRKLRCLGHAFARTQARHGAGVAIVEREGQPQRLARRCGQFADQFCFAQRRQRFGLPMVDMRRQRLDQIAQDRSRAGNIDQIGAV